MSTAISTRCQVCQHPERDNINSRMVAGIPSRTIAEEFSLHYKACQNHKNKHLPKQMVQAQGLQEQESADRLLNQVNDLYEKSLLLIDKADTDHKWNGVAAAIREARNCLELTGKLVGMLKTGNNINIVYNQEFIAVRAEIYEALRPYPEAREAVVNALEGGVTDAEYEEINCS